MTITPRGNSYQVVINAQGRRYRKSFKTQKEAEEDEKRALAAIDQGGWPDDSTVEPERRLPLTLKELLQYVHESHWANVRSGEALYKTAVRMVNQLGPHRLLKDLKTFDIEQAMMALQRKGNSNATLNRKGAALSKMLTIAERIEAIDKKPHVPHYNEAIQRIRVITSDEEKKLLTWAAKLDPLMVDFIKVGLDTGMRLGEILNTRVTDCQNDKISVWQTKNGKPRFIPMTSRVKAVVAKATTEKRTMLIPLTRKQVERLWDIMKENMELGSDEQFVRHTMRHTFCSRLAARGVDVETIKDLAGHSTITTTQRYMHAFAPVVEDAIRKLEQTI